MPFIKFGLMLVIPSVGSLVLVLIGGLIVIPGFIGPGTPGGGGGPGRPGGGGGPRTPGGGGGGAGPPLGGGGGGAGPPIMGGGGGGGGSAAAGPLEAERLLGLPPEPDPTVLMLELEAVFKLSLSMINFFISS